MLSQCAYSYGVKIIKLAWLGTRTENFEPTVDFFRDVLGLQSELDLPGFRVLKLPDGSKVEVFGPDSDINRHFTTGPVAGFLVDDVSAAASELRSNRIESSLLNRTKAVMPGCTSARRTATSMSSHKILAFRGRIKNRRSSSLNCTKSPYRWSVQRHAYRGRGGGKERSRKCAIPRLECCRPPLNDGPLEPWRTG
jgi:hypothetical protein